MRRSEIYHLAQYAVLTCTALPDTDKLEILEQLVVDARSARWSADLEIVGCDECVSMVDAWEVDPDEM